MITMKSPESENYLGRKIPPFEPDEVRMWIRIGCLYSEMIDENTTLVKFMISADGNIVRKNIGFPTFSACKLRD